MRTLNTAEVNDVSGGTFGLLSCLFSFCAPQPSYCAPAPKPAPAPKNDCQPAPRKRRGC